MQKIDEKFVIRSDDSFECQLFLLKTGTLFPKRDEILLHVQNVVY